MQAGSGVKGAPLRGAFIRPLTRDEAPGRERGFVLSRSLEIVIEVSGAIAIANTIAYISELLDPLCIFLELTRQSLMGQSLRYNLWGKANWG